MSKSALNPLDLFDVRSELSEEETMVQETVGRFVDASLNIVESCFQADSSTTASSR